MGIMKELNMSMDDALLQARRMIDSGKELFQAMSEMLDILESNHSIPTPAVVETPALAKQAEEKAEGPRTATLEEVRGRLAEKSRSGFRAEVKALLTAHGVEKLSEITEPAELGTLLEEAGQIGAG